MRTGKASRAALTSGLAAVFLVLAYAGTSSGTPTSRERLQLELGPRLIAAHYDHSCSTSELLRGWRCGRGDDSVHVVELVPEKRIGVAQPATVRLLLPSRGTPTGIRVAFVETVRYHKMGEIALVELRGGPDGRITLPTMAATKSYLLIALQTRGATVHKWVWLLGAAPAPRR